MIDKKKAREIANEVLSAKFVDPYQKTTPTNAEFYSGVRETILFLDSSPKFVPAFSTVIFDDEDRYIWEAPSSNCWEDSLAIIHERFSK